MALGDQHVFGFSPNGKLFALRNEQGILRIWDIETNELKQEFTPNLRLTGSCSTLTWIELKDETKNRSEEHELYIALGTSTGQVYLYAYNVGKIEQQLKGEGHSGKVTSIVYNSNTLFTCGEDCQIILWNISQANQISSWSIGNEKPISITYLDHSKTLVVGTREIQVYSLDTQELIQTFSGHTSEVNLITSFVINESNEYIVTASKMERIICIWKIGKKGRNKSVTSTLLMEDIAYCLTCRVDATGTIKIVSVTRSGVIHVYLIPSASVKTEKPIKPKLTIEIVSDSSPQIQPIPAVAASLFYSNNPENILIGYGDKHFISFEQLEPNYIEKVQVLIRNDPKKLYLKSGVKQNSEIQKTITPNINTQDVDYKTALTVSKKSLKCVEMPMESRLQNLNLNASSGRSNPQSQSKVQLLVQALHSKDEMLLRGVLCTHDIKTINVTLIKLPVQYIGILVNELTLLMQQKRINVVFALNWLKALVKIHSSQLMALGVDDLLNKFGPCIGIIEHRTSCLKELSKLTGRLYLLVSQIKRNTEVDTLSNENVLIYEDNDSSNSDLDEIGDKSTSDDDWVEDSDEIVNNVEDNYTMDAS